MNKKGFTPIAIVLLVLAGLAILGTGVYYYSHANENTSVATSTSPVVTSTTSTLSKPQPPVVTPTSTTIIVSGLSPVNGPVGTVVTIHGSGFAATGNMVTMSGLVGPGFKDLSSSNNGTVITFSIPSSLGPNCQPDRACPEFMLLVTARAYDIQVISNGETQDVGTFTVTGSSTFTQ